MQKKEKIIKTEKNLIYNGVVGTLIPTEWLMEPWHSYRATGDPAHQVFVMNKSLMNIGQLAQ